MPDGSWRLLGRANEVFKRFGEKISLPALLTSVKTAWAGDAACYREIDPAGEEGYVLVLSPEPSGQQLRDVLMAFRKHHARPHWPLRIESLELMPLLPNGKPDVRSLRDAADKQLHWRQRI
jgi:acyl-CoA synthetase (AMP-forming)/AMP-acid ligase II